MMVNPHSPNNPPEITYENQIPGEERPLFRELLSRAHELGLANVKTKCLSVSDPPERRAVFKATVTMVADHGTTDFSGHGDSDKTNTHPLILPHYIRMAETRAIARALRWATNEGLTCAEELPSFDGFINSVDFVNKTIARPAKQTPEDKTSLINAIERGETFLAKHKESVEEVEKLRRKLPKPRLGENLIEDLERYCEELRKQYKKHNPDAKETDEQ